MKKILFIPLLFPCLVFAQLKNCIETGLAQNFEIKITKNTQQISDNNHNAGNAGYLPALDLAAGYSGTLDDEEQKPRTGGDIIKNNGVENSQLNAGISLNWTVFDGFGIQANYARLTELQQIGELNTRLAIENFIAELSTEYYNYVQQNIRLKNLRSAVKLSKERLRIVEARYSIGSLSRFDLQQARVDFNADSSKLILQQETLFGSHIKLNKLMANENFENQLPISDTVIVFDALLAKDDAWHETEKSNIYLLLQEKEKSLSALDLKSSRSQNYPYLRLNAGYGYTQNRQDLSNYKYRNTLGFNYGVTLGYNLFNGFKNSIEQKNAKIRLENKKLEQKQLLLSVKSDFANIWMAYQNNIGLTALEQENLHNAQENYEIAMERYKVGDLSGIELREAQISLQEAEERLVKAQYNTKLCEISILQISGQIGKYLE